MLHCKENFAYLKNTEITKCVSKGLVGGLSHLSLRYIKANSERLGDKIENDSQRKELIYCDVNNAFAHAMLNNLFPVGNYELIVGEEAQTFDVYKVVSDKIQENSFLVNVDLKYPEFIKKFTADFPLVPEKRRIDKHNLGKQQHDVFYSAFPLRICFLQ